MIGLLLEQSASNNSVQNANQEEWLLQSMAICILLRSGESGMSPFHGSQKVIVVAAAARSTRTVRLYYSNVVIQYYIQYILTVRTLYFDTMTVTR
jgi:hypothetical protein